MDPRRQEGGGAVVGDGPSQLHLPDQHRHVSSSFSSSSLWRLRVLILLLGLMVADGLQVGWKKLSCWSNWVRLQLLLVDLLQLEMLILLLELLLVDLLLM